MTKLEVMVAVKSLPRHEQVEIASAIQEDPEAVSFDKAAWLAYVHDPLRREEAERFVASMTEEDYKEIEELSKTAHLARPLEEFIAEIREGKHDIEERSHAGYR